LIEDIHDVERIVSAFVGRLYNVDHVHVLQVDYENDVWTAQGGFITKDCPLATFAIKVDRQEHILSQRIVCAIPPREKGSGEGLHLIGDPAKRDGCSVANL
jgi:hypothetical protein